MDAELPNNKGEKMKKFLVLILFLAMAGCSQLWSPNCGSMSIYQAHVMTIRGYETRIAITPTEQPGIYHAQAQALVGGEWRWLSSDYAQVWLGEKESTFPVNEYKTLKAAVETYGK